MGTIGEVETKFGVPAMRVLRDEDGGAIDAAVLTLLDEGKDGTSSVGPELVMTEGGAREVAPGPMVVDAGVVVGALNEAGVGDDATTTVPFEATTKRRCAWGQRIH